MVIYVRTNPESDLHKLQMFFADVAQDIVFCVISSFETECRNVFV